MADRATQLVNFFETTSVGILPSGDDSMTLADSPGVSASLADEDTWFYLVIDPDNSGSREVITVKTSSGTSLSLIERDLENDYLGSPPDHQSGTTVRMAVLAQHITDQNDRVTTNISDLDSALTTFNTDSASAITTFNTNSASAISTFNTDSAQEITDFNTDSASAISTFNTNSSSAITTFNSDGATAISNINASSATSMVSNATDGTSIDVDIDNDYMVVYDATDSTSKKVYANQTNKELKGYKETDVALTSTSGVVAIDLNNGNTGSLTLTENVTDIDFTNVPVNGVGTFTLKITQDSTTAYTVAINAITVNGGGDVTAKTAGAGGYTMTATLDAEDLLFFLFFDESTPYLTASQEMS